jgi:hypothetical protein
MVLDKLTEAQMRLYGAVASLVVFVLVVLGSYGLGYWHKSIKASAQQDAALAKQAEKHAKAERDHVAALAKKNAELEALRGAVNVRVVKQYVDRIKIVREKGDEIVKTIYEQAPQLDRACPALPIDWGVLHDTAARHQQFTQAASRADGAGGVIARIVRADQDAEFSAALDDPADVPVGPKPSEALAEVARNYERCKRNAIKLDELQNWWRGVEQAQLSKQQGEK